MNSELTLFSQQITNNAKNHYFALDNAHPYTARQTVTRDINNWMGNLTTPAIF